MVANTFTNSLLSTQQRNEWKKNLWTTATSSKTVYLTLIKSIDLNNLNCMEKSTFVYWCARRGRTVSCKISVVFTAVFSALLFYQLYENVANKLFMFPLWYSSKLGWLELQAIRSNFKVLLSGFNYAHIGSSFRLLGNLFNFIAYARAQLGAVIFIGIKWVRHNYVLLWFNNGGGGARLSNVKRSEENVPKLFLFFLQLSSLT